MNDSSNRLVIFCCRKDWNYNCWKLMTKVQNMCPTQDNISEFYTKFSLCGVGLLDVLPLIQIHQLFVIYSKHVAINLMLENMGCTKRSQDKSQNTWLCFQLKKWNGFLIRNDHLSGGYGYINKFLWSQALFWNHVDSWSFCLCYIFIFHFCFLQAFTKLFLTQGSHKGSQRK